MKGYDTEHRTPWLKSRTRSTTQLYTGTHLHRVQPLTRALLSFLKLGRSSLKRIGECPKITRIYWSTTTQATHDAR